MLLVKLIEPPCTERYARWCERSGNLVKFPSYSIFFHLYTVFHCARIIITVQRRHCEDKFSHANSQMQERHGDYMYIEIDFNSDEALYLQLRNQIIIGIATSQYQEGDTLPSVRQLADTIGINMHTVNKAYSVLKQEGFVKVDRRKGAVISVDIDKLQAMEELKKDLQVVLAKSRCKKISKQEVHALIDEIYQNYEDNGGIE